MAAIDYLLDHGLQAKVLPDKRLYVWPSENITPEVRLWIRMHKAEVLRELLPANDNRRAAWHITHNGKHIVMLAMDEPLTREQALESAKARWPHDEIGIE